MTEDALLEVIRSYPHNFPMTVFPRRIADDVLLAKVFFPGRRDSWNVFLVLKPGTDACVGAVADAGESDLVVITDPDYRRQGHMLRALRGEILPFLFDSGRERQEVTFSSDNLAIVGLLRKVGFVLASGCGTVLPADVGLGATLGMKVARPIGQFSLVLDRVFELCVRAERLLAGCASGLMALSKLQVPTVPGRSAFGLPPSYGPAAMHRCAERLTDLRGALQKFRRAHAPQRHASSRLVGPFPQLTDLSRHLNPIVGDVVLGQILLGMAAAACESTGTNFDELDHIKGRLSWEEGHVESAMWTPTDS